MTYTEKDIETAINKPTDYKLNLKILDRTIIAKGLAVSVCNSYGSCYRPEKMQHEKECGKHCSHYKQTDS